jgi:tRNA(Ile)-lysidine synthase
MQGHQQFLKDMQKTGLLSNHRRLLLALSGGQDSMTLLSWLYANRETLEIAELGLAHVNHKQRPESDEEEVGIQALAAQLHLPLYIAHYPADQPFSEKAARDFRYGFFKTIMLEHNYTALLTAHHQDDQVETVLMRLIRGAHLPYLSGIKPTQSFGNGSLIRPLLSYKKSQLDATDFYEDASNASHDYQRNRVRNHLLPELQQENPQINRAVLQLADETRRAMRVIHNQISQTGVLEDGKIRLATYRTLSEDLRYFTLQAFIGNYPDFQPSRQLFNDLQHLLDKPKQAQVPLAHGYTLIKEEDLAYLTKEQNVPEFDILRAAPISKESWSIDIPKGASYRLRPRQPGDKILVNGYHKTLKKYYIDQKVPLSQRQYPVLEVDGEVYGVPFLVHNDLSKDLENVTIKDTLWLIVSTSAG